MKYQIDTYAVIGHPVAHSLSPGVHAAFAQQTGQKLDYIKLEAPLDGFKATVEAFRARGGKGFNVTLPFKGEACAWVTRCSEAAQLSGAVNTVKFEDDGSTFGDNTDGVGLVRDILQNHGGVIYGKRLLVLGAGGAVRGILGPLQQQQPAQLTIANRTLEKAWAIARGAVVVCGYPDLAGQQFDFIINGTSASLQGQIPPLVEGLLSPHGWCYDLAYTTDETPFQAWGWAQGAAKSLDGKGMLIEQAAESFFIWRGVRPKTHRVLQALVRYTDRS